VGEYALGADHRMYDVHPDGRRFVMLRVVGPNARYPNLVLVQNFFEELKRLVPN